MRPVKLVFAKSGVNVCVNPDTFVKAYVPTPYDPTNPTTCLEFISSQANCTVKGTLDDVVLSLMK